MLLFEHGYQIYYVTYLLENVYTKVCLERKWPQNFDKGLSLCLMLCRNVKFDKNGKTISKVSPFLSLNQT